MKEIKVDMDCLNVDDFINYEINQGETIEGFGRRIALNAIRSAFFDCATIRVDVDSECNLRLFAGFNIGLSGELSGSVGLDIVDAFDAELDTLLCDHDRDEAIKKANEVRDAITRQMQGVIDTLKNRDLTTAS